MANISTTTTGFPTVVDTYTAASSGDRVPSAHYNGLASAVVALEKHTFGPVNVKTYGVTGDGSTDDRANIKTAIEASFGKTLYFPSGTYVIGSTCTPTITGDVTIICDSGAVFQAASGFSTNNRLFLFQNGTADANLRFYWQGGKLNGANIPAPGSGDANDLLQVIGRGWDLVAVERVWFYTNTDYSGTAGDSHLFISECDNIRVSGCRFEGATDAAVYLSGDSGQTLGTEAVIAENHFEKCSVGVIAKRSFRRMTVAHNTLEKCRFGIGTGEADTTLLPGANNLIIGNHLRQPSDIGIFVRVSDHSAVIGNRVEDFGYNLSDAVVSGASGIRLEGSNHCVVQGNVVNMRSFSTDSSHIAIRLGAYTVNGTAYNSTSNLVIGNRITDVYTPVEETTSSQNANHILHNTVTGNTNAITKRGANSLVWSLPASTDTNYIDFTYATTGNAPRLVAAGSDTNIPLWLASKGSNQITFRTNTTSEQMRVSHTASAVNYVNVTGGTTGNPVQITAQGSDSGIPLWLASKGSNQITLRTDGSTEQLRVSHVASAVNYVDITGAVTGSPVKVAAAGTDTNIDVHIDPKGSGVVRFGTHSAIGAETVTGYITIKDDGGTTRKIAVVS